MKVKDFDVELTGNVDSAGGRVLERSTVEKKKKKKKEKANSRDIAVDDLDHGKRTSISHDIKGLRLDTCIMMGLPFEVVLGGNGVRGCSCLLGNGMEGLRSVDGFLGAGDRCETGRHGLARTLSSFVWNHTLT